MKRCDSPDCHLCQDLAVDCGFPKVIASRVGVLGSSFAQAAKTGDFSRAKREKPPPDASAADDSYIPRFPLEKMREFTLKELEKATENFNRKRVLGLGGFGEVFKGILSDATVVAVKVLVKDSVQGLEQFKAEMRVSCAIMSLPHPNLVPAIGFHSSGKRKNAKVMILYPFMANGALDCYLVDRQPSSLTPLDWPTRKKIALGIARGICSLHELGIVHRDIKPFNVLLDESFNAYVGNFGLSKSMDLPRNSCNAAQFHGDEDSLPCISTRLWGTAGYAAPEVLSHGRYSRKSDVYGFGITLILLLTGIPFNHRLEEGARSRDVLYKAEKLLKNEEDLMRYMPPSMLGMYDESEAIELIRLGLVCAQHDPQKRPLMPEVIAIMEGSSAATLKQRYDGHDHTCSEQQLSANNQSETGFSYSHNVVVNKEELEENGYDGDQLRRAKDSPSQELNKEYRVGDAWHQRQGHQSAVSCYNSMQPNDASGGVSSAESTSLANSISLENDTLVEIVEVDQKDRENSKQLSSQANRYEGQSDEVVTKLREVLDQMRAMELNLQATMEEMHQKQNAIMQSIITMQEQYNQRVYDMQSQINQLNGASGKL